MSSLGVPISVESSDISSALNSVVLFIFLMGTYTVIYFGTIYVYFTKNRSKYHLVPAAITTLYLNSMAMTGIQWYSVKWEFINNGDTRDSVFFGVLLNPRWLYILFIAFSCISYAIADGLLIWRCYYVWDRSLHIISVLLFLIMTEIALFLAEISFDARYTSWLIPFGVAAKIDALLAAAYFMSFTTTLVTTVLIAYRIHSVTKRQGGSSRRFKHIVDIVVQSGMIYALSQFAAAMAGVLPGSSSAVNTRNVAFEDYVEILNFAIAGISTTVMVARVAMLSADATYPSTSGHLSGLQFQAYSTHPTVDVAVIEVTHSVDDSTSSASERQEVENKV